MPICRSACKTGKSSVDPDGGGALPQGSSAQRVLCATLMVTGCHLFMLFSLKVGGKGKATCTAEKTQEMTETKFALHAMSAWLLWNGGKPGKVGAEPPWMA